MHEKRIKIDKSLFCIHELNYMSGMSGFSHTNWYVLVNGQAYGPYTHETMVEFVREGRVVSSSMISTQPQQAYVAAGTLQIFQHWHTQARQLAQQAQHPTVSTPQTHIQTPRAQPVQASHIKETIYIIMAEIDQKAGMNFLRTMQSFGHVQRIGESVWILHAQQNLNKVKTDLSLTLSGADRLFIHDCFANQQDWQNIGGDLNQRMREIWQSVKR